MDTQSEAQTGNWREDPRETCLVWESRLSPCACLQNEKGMCDCVCVPLCEVSSFRTGKRHTHAFTNKNTHRCRHTGCIVAPSLCLWQGSLKVSINTTMLYQHLNRMQGVFFQVQPPLHTQLYTHTYVCIRGVTVHTSHCSVRTSVWG